MLISFEGLDNCGKTTIVGKLKKYYDGLNILTDFTREFETNIGREIKEMSKAGVLDPVLKTYLFGKRLNFRHGYKNPRPHFCNRSTLIIHI